MTVVKSALAVPVAGALFVLATALPAAATDAYSIGTDHINTKLDLGVDVSNVVRTPDSVEAYLKGLPPETERALMAACENYMQHPTSAQAIETLGFCRVAVQD